MDSAAEQQAAALPRRSRLAGCLHVQEAALCPECGALPGWFGGLGMGLRARGHAARCRRRRGTPLPDSEAPPQEQPPLPSLPESGEAAPPAEGGAPSVASRAAEELAHAAAAAVAKKRAAAAEEPIHEVPRLAQGLAVEPAPAPRRPWHPRDEPRLLGHTTPAGKMPEAKEVPDASMTTTRMGRGSGWREAEVLASAPSMKEEARFLQARSVFAKVHATLAAAEPPPPPAAAEPPEAVSSGVLLRLQGAGFDLGTTPAS